MQVFVRLKGELSLEDTTNPEKDKEKTLVPREATKNPSSPSSVEELEHIMFSIHALLEAFQANEQSSESLNILCERFESLKEFSQRNNYEKIVEMIWAIENMLNRALDGTIQFDLSMMTVIKLSLMALDGYESNGFLLVPSVQDDLDRVSEQADLIASGIESYDLKDLFSSSGFDKLSRKLGNFVSATENETSLPGKLESPADSLPIADIELDPKKDHETNLRLRSVLDDLTRFISKKATLEKELSRVLLTTFEQIEELKKEFILLERNTELLQTDKYDEHGEKKTITESIEVGQSIQQRLKKSLLRINDIAEDSASFSNELQKSLKQTRNIPFAQLIPGLESILKSISTEYGKKIVLRFFNDDEQISETILVEIQTLIESFIGYSAKNSIELPMDRILLEKPDTGKIEIGLSRSKGILRIALVDDGKGLLKESIRKQAVATGLMKSESPLSDNEAMQFVLASEFSQFTLENPEPIDCTDLAGAHQLLKKLGGHISLESHARKGLSISVWLPDDVCIISALIFIIDGDTFAVQSDLVEGIDHLQGSSVFTKDPIPVTDVIVDGRGYELVSTLNVEDLMKKDLKTMQVPVVLFSLGEATLALAIDRIVGIEQVIIKSHKNTLGSGEIAPILATTIENSLVVVQNPRAFLKNK